MSETKYIPENNLPPTLVGLKNSKVIYISRIYKTFQELRTRWIDDYLPTRNQLFKSLKVLFELLVEVLLSFILAGVAFIVHLLLEDEWREPVNTNISVNFYSDQDYSPSIQDEPNQTCSILDNNENSAVFPQNVNKPVGNINSLSKPIQQIRDPKQTNLNLKSNSNAYKTQSISNYADNSAPYKFPKNFQPYANKPVDDINYFSRPIQQIRDSKQTNLHLKSNSNAYETQSVSNHSENSTPYNSPKDFPPNVYKTENGENYFPNQLRDPTQKKDLTQLRDPRQSNSHLKSDSDAHETQPISNHSENSAPFVSPSVNKQVYGINSFSNQPGDPLQLRDSTQLKNSSRQRDPTQPNDSSKLREQTQLKDPTELNDPSKIKDRTQLKDPIQPNDASRLRDSTQLNDPSPQKDSKQTNLHLKSDSNASETKSISNASETKSDSNASETKSISNASETKSDSNASETKSISNASETKSISNASETKSISNYSEKSASYVCPGGFQPNVNKTVEQRNYYLKQSKDMKPPKAYEKIQSKRNSISRSSTPTSVPENKLNSPRGEKSISSNRNIKITDQVQPNLILKETTNNIIQFGDI